MMIYIVMIFLVAFCTYIAPLRGVPGEVTLHTGRTLLYERGQSELLATAVRVHLALLSGAQRPPSLLGKPALVVTLKQTSELK